MPECMMPEKYDFFFLNVSVIFYRAHVIIYNISVNYIGLPLKQLSIFGKVTCLYDDPLHSPATKILIEAKEGLKS